MLSQLVATVTAGSFGETVADRQRGRSDFAGIPLLGYLRTSKPALCSALPGGRQLPSESSRIEVVGCNRIPSVASETV